MMTFMFIGFPDVHAGIVQIPFKGDSVNLHTFQNDASGMVFANPGVQQINNALLAIVQWFKYVLGTIATVWCVWQGYRMLSSGGDGDQFESAKKSIMWGIIGLVLSFLVEPMIRTVIYGGMGGLAPGQALLKPEISFLAGKAEIIGLMNWIKTMLGIISVAMIIFTGIQAMLALDSEEQTDTQKTNVRWIMIGIIIIIFNEIIVEYGLYGNVHLENNKPVTLRDPTRLISEFGGFLGYYLTFFAAVAVGGLAYGGYLILTSNFEESQTEKGKEIMKNTAIGIVIVLVSYVLVRTVIMLQN